VTRKKRLAALQITAQANALNQIMAHPKSAYQGLQALMARDLTLGARYSNIDQRRIAVMSQFSQHLAEAMDRMRIKGLGFMQDRDLANRVVRELFGESTGDADARAFAKAFGAAFEDARIRFNQAGGAIPKRKDWGLPQNHDARRVRKVSRETWKDFIRPRLERSKMLDGNGRTLTDQELEFALDEAYETIRTDGLSKMSPGAQGGVKLANAHRDHRFFSFRDGEAWLEYQTEYGIGDPYLTMVQHLENMSGEIALLEIMGPNPTHMYKFLRDTVQKQGRTSFAASDWLWNTISGKANTAGNLDPKIADGMDAVRNFLTSVRLGSAMLSATSDLAFFRQTAHWNGLSQARAVKHFVALLNPANTADRQRAVRIGLLADAWSTFALAANRFTEVTGAGLSARAADFTMRASGLSAWTDAAQKAIGMEFLSTAADLSARTWDDLPSDFRGAIEAGGFKSNDWDILRQGGQERWKGISQIDLSRLDEAQGMDPAAVRRVDNLTREVIAEITNAAVPMPDAKARSIATLGTSRNTVEGQVARSVAQFKSFPISVILSHVYRGINQGSRLSKGAYIGELVLGTSVMGALALQLKEVARGRDPRPMDDAKFWAAAFTQGGGAGIFGDFFYAGAMGTNRFGTSLVGTLAGPTVGLIEDVAKVSLGQLGEAASGDDLNLGKDLIGFTGRNIPTASSLWYTRLAFERLVQDQLSIQFDPKARARFRRQQKYRRREFDQDYWWRPGEPTPDRAPEP